MTDNASARCTRIALSRAIAPGSTRGLERRLRGRGQLRLARGRPPVDRRRGRRSCGRGTRAGNRRRPRAGRLPRGGPLTRRPRQTWRPSGSPRERSPVRSARSRPGGARTAIVRMLSLIVGRQDEPARHGQPAGHAREHRVGDAVRIEARIDRANHVGEDIGTRQLPPKWRLPQPQPRRKIRTLRGRRVPARGSTGARLPTSPVNRLCVPLEWRIPLSPSIHRKYSTSDGRRARLGGHRAHNSVRFPPPRRGIKRPR